MKTFARIQDGRVAELLATARDPSKLFHPALVWQLLPSDLSSRVGVRWNYDNGTFLPPIEAGASEQPISLAGLRAQVDALARAVQALAPNS